MADQGLILTVKTTQTLIHLPDDISVVGFDDPLAPYLSPPLTAVAQPMEAIGRAAVQLALAEIEAPEGNHKPQVRRLSMRWVERASTASPRPPMG
jgi:LacI family transcriptional regulator